MGEGRMSSEILVHSCDLPVDSESYEILIYSRPDGSFVAKTVLDVYDIIINDGLTLDDVLKKHSELLPLAIKSRRLFSQSRH
jgi:hypothetical protein